MTLKISPSGDKLSFAFSVPVNNVYFVRMSYTAKLDGSDADVKNAQGDRVGTIQITRAGPAQYKIFNPSAPTGPTVRASSQFRRTAKP